jgi:hypothetical protein
VNRHYRFAFSGLNGYSEERSPVRGIASEVAWPCWAPENFTESDGE